MFFSLQTQFLICLQSFLLGAIIGLYYDVLRAVREHYHAKTAMTFICDSIFGLGAVFLLFEFGLNFAAGQNRFYFLVAASFGMIFYFKTISIAVCLVLRTVLGFLKKVRKMAKLCVKKIAHLAGTRKFFEKITEKVKKTKKNTSIFRKKGIK